MQRNEISWYFVLAPPKRGIDFLLSHHYQGSDGFNTDCHKEMYFLLHPLGWTNGSTVTLPWVGMYRFVHSLPTSIFPSTLEMSLGTSLLSRWMYTTHNKFWLEYKYSLLINPSPGMYQELPPSRAIGIDGFKINLSLVMMRQWKIWTNVICTSTKSVDMISLWYAVIKTSNKRFYFIDIWHFHLTFDSCDINLIDTV